MTLSPELATELYAILTEEYLLSGELLALIAQEKQQLARNDQTALNASTKGKHQLLDRLQGVTAQRLALVGIDGLDLPPRWYDSLNEFPALARQHALLLDLVQKLREENQTLGRMLSHKALFVTRLLDNLGTETGNNLSAGNGLSARSSLSARNSTVHTYQSDGSRNHDTGTRKLITV